jgi:hypothetical protein
MDSKTPTSAQQFTSALTPRRRQLWSPCPHNTSTMPPSTGPEQCQDDIVGQFTPRICCPTNSCRRRCAFSAAEFLCH